jgi:hypothetical protein
MQVPEISSTRWTFNGFLPKRLLSTFNKFSNTTPNLEIIIFHHQFGFGMREILLEFMRLPDDFIFLGVMQHGANLPGSDYPWKSPRYPYFKKTKSWVWSERELKIAHAQGVKNATAIGAPWLYMNQSKIPILPKKDTLIMPSHQNTGFQKHSSYAEKRKFVNYFSLKSNPDTSTVCLHYLDFLDTEFRNLFMEKGYEITCAGIPGYENETGFSAAGDRSNFLYNLRALMESHETLLTDSVGTHVYYAIERGMKIGIFYEANEFRPSQTNHGFGDFQAIERRKIESSFRGALNTVSPPVNYLPEVNEMLGVNDMLSKNQLLDVMDFKRITYLTDLLA